jgi:pyruvate,orthophosphate dikinase
MEMAKVMNISYNDIHEGWRGLMEVTDARSAGCRWVTSIPKSPRCRPCHHRGRTRAEEEGITAIPEIMVPLTGIVYEFKAQRRSSKRHSQVFSEHSDSIEYKRYDDEIRVLHLSHRLQGADFFSFGTKDLTQMTSVTAVMTWQVLRSISTRYLKQDRLPCSTRMVGVSW